MTMLMRRQIWRRHVSAAGVLIAAVAGSAGALGGEPAADLPDGQRLLENLLQADAKMQQAFSAVVEVTEPAHMMWPELGTMTRTGVLVCAAEISCLVLEYPRFEKAPAYMHHGSGRYDGIDYDAEQNFILWRKGDFYFLRDANLNDTFETQVVHGVAPDNSVIRTAESGMLRKHTVTDPDGSYVFERVLLASGRGFGQHLETFKDIAIGSSGLIEARATGLYGCEIRGEWLLKIDPAAGHLVRSASFTPLGRTEPSLLVTTTGTQGGDSGPMPVAGEMTFRVASAHYEFRTILKPRIASHAADQAIIDRVRAKVAGDLPIGTDVWDHRVDAKILRWQVGEENN